MSIKKVSMWIYCYHPLNFITMYKNGCDSYTHQPVYPQYVCNVERKHVAKQLPSKILFQYKHTLLPHTVNSVLTQLWCAGTSESGTVSGWTHLRHLCSGVPPGTHVHHGQSRGDAEWWVEDVVRFLTLTYLLKQVQGEVSVSSSQWLHCWVSWESI